MRQTPIRVIWPNRSLCHAVRSILILKISMHNFCGVNYSRWHIWYFYTYSWWLIHIHTSDFAYEISNNTSSCCNVLQLLKLLKVYSVVLYIPRLTFIVIPIIFSQVLLLVIKYFILNIIYYHNMVDMSLIPTSKYIWNTHWLSVIIWS